MIADQSIQAIEAFAHFYGFDCKTDLRRTPSPKLARRFHNANQPRQIGITETLTTFDALPISQH